MKILWVSSIICALLSMSCSSSQSDRDNVNLQFKTPDSLSLFAKGIISTSQYERDLAISPDGNELYFTLVSPRNRMSVIMYSKRENDIWSQPEIVSISGKFRDLEPAFSPDGNQLYFASNRTEDQSDVKADFDIWVTERMEDDWKTPTRLDTIINTSADEFYPSIATNGNLYFTASYSNAKGREDIYVSRKENGVFQTPESLDTAINTASFEFNAFVAPDESYLIFSSFGRADGKGGGDLYISEKDNEGNWLAAKPMSELNSQRLDYSPFVLGDSLLFFTSERTIFDVEKIQAYSTKEFQAVLNGSQNGDGDIYYTQLKK